MRDTIYLTQDTYFWLNIVSTATGCIITRVSEATAKDVNAVVEAAQKAFETSWGLNTPGTRRAELLNKLAQLMETRRDELAALESLDNGEFGHPSSSCL